MEVVHGVVRREERIWGRVGGGDKELRRPEIGGEEGRADGGPTAREREEETRGSLMEVTRG